MSVSIPWRMEVKDFCTKPQQSVVQPFSSGNILHVTLSIYDVCLNVASFDFQALKFYFRTNLEYCEMIYLQVIWTIYFYRSVYMHVNARIFKWIFVNENVWIPNKISLKFVPQGPINNIQALVQIMAWRRPGDKPLSGPMMVRLMTHICVTRPQWVKIAQSKSSRSVVHKVIA